MAIFQKNSLWFFLSLVVGIFSAHYLLLYYIIGYSWPISTIDASVSTAVLALAVWGCILIIRVYPTTVAIILYALLVASFFTLLVGMTDWQLLKYLITDDDYSLWLRNTLLFRLLIIWLLASWIATYTALQKKTETLEVKFLQQSDAATLLREAELFKLRQQLQPHFLYNSLNSISSLIIIAPDKAQEMIGKLSDFLRSSVKREAQDLIPINEEMAYIESYLAIESIRFGDRLQVDFEKEYTDDATMPPFLLQPILENAIKFGLYGKTGQVIITIHILLQKGNLLITATNPFDPTTRPPRGTGFGLEGVQRRLYLLYARTDLLETKNDSETFTTILKIPQSHVQSNNY